VLSESQLSPSREPGRYVHALLSAKRLVYERRRAALGDGAAGGVRLGDERRRAGAALAAEVRVLFDSGRAASALGENATAPSPDTVAVAVADRTGALVTLSQSLGPLFGSGICDPASGFCLHSRGYGFAIGAAAEAAGHANLYAPKKRPFHTLSPLLLHCGAWQLALACKGGDRVPYAAASFLWQLLDSLPALAARGAGDGAVEPPTPSQLAAALAAPRVRDAGGPQPFAPAVQGSPANPPVEAEPGAVVDGAVGYTFVPPSNRHFEDSGFAVLHDAVVRVAPFDSAQRGLESPHSLIAAADVTRKPGEARVLAATAAGKGGGGHDMAAPGATTRGDGAAVLLARWANMLPTTELPGADATVHRYKGHSPVSCSASTICPSRASSPVIGGLVPSCGASVMKPPPHFSHFLSFHCATYPRAPAMSRVFPMGRVRLLSPTAFVFAIGEDKVAWQSWLRALGLGRYLPASVVLNAEKVIMGAATATNKRIAVKLVDMAAQQGLHLPMAIKVPGLLAGSGVQVVQTIADVQRALAVLRRAGEHRAGKLVGTGHALMLQEAVQSKNETTINLAAFSGRLLSAHAVCFSYS